MNECPSRFTLVQYLAGELQAEEREAVSRHLEQCPGCRERLAETEANAAAYAADQEQHLERFRSRLSEQPETAPARPTWLRLAPAAGVLAAAAAVLLLLLPALEPGPGRPAEEEIRFKGTMAFEVVARRESRQFRVEPGSELRSGDALRFVVAAATPGYLTVFSLDAAGSPSAFYPDTDPARDRAPLRLERAGRHELPGSIILDDSRGDEALVVAFSAEPFDREQVHGRASSSDWYRYKREPGKGEMGPGIEAGAIWIEKGP